MLTNLDPGQPPVDDRPVTGSDPEDHPTGPGRMVLIVLMALVALFVLAVMALAAAVIAGRSTPSPDGGTTAAGEPVADTSEPIPPATIPAGTVSETSARSGGPAGTIAGAGDTTGSDDEPPSTPALTDSPLTLRGMGPLRVGMTVVEAESALGSPIVEVYELAGECRYGVVAQDGSSPDLMISAPDGDFRAGTILRIELNAEAHATLSGIKLGSTRADVLAAYGDHIVAGPHAYHEGEYLTYVPSDSSDGRYRIVFEVLDDRVTGIRSGLLPQVEWVEGCA